jgi:hypothetical protein
VAALPIPVGSGDAGLALGVLKPASTPHNSPHGLGFFARTRPATTSLASENPSAGTGKIVKR